MADDDVKNKPSRNTPKGDESSVYIPGNFKIITMKLTDADGNNTEDIENIVDSFSITEELFSPVVTFTATIRDTNNFFEKFPIVGQERLTVNIKKIDPIDSSNDINLNHIFYVKEYPNFVRTLDFPATQIYTLVAISDFAYASNLFTICRSIKGNPVDNISKILKDDLGLTTVETDSGSTKCKSDFEGIITIQTPLTAAEWLRSRCFDSEGSPFFMYNKLSKKKTICLHSWNYFSKKSSYKDYYYRQIIKEKPGSVEAYKAETSRILSMKSNIRLDRLDLAKQGAYASRLNVTDYASKAFYTKDFNAKTGTDTSVEFKSHYYKVSSKSGTSRKQLPELPNASITGLQINTAKVGSEKGNSTTTALLDNAMFAKSFLANMNSANHEISVYGDVRLNPGVKINLTIPQAIKLPDGDTIDKSLSGDYIITVSSHTFIEGIYINRLKLVKNIFPTGKTSSGSITSSSSGVTQSQAFWNKLLNLD